MGDYLKFPTDSLYKLIAIAGLLAIAFCFYSKWTARSDLIKAANEFQKEDHKRIEQLMFAPTFKIPLLRSIDLPEKPDVEYLMGSFDERNAWRTFLDNIMELLQSHSQAASRSEMDAYFARQDVRAYYLEQKETTESDYAKMTKMPLGDFNELFKDEFDYFRNSHRLYMQHNMALRPFWQLVNEYRAIEAHASFGAKLGAVVCILGFGLWWYFIQRHEDVVLRCERMSAVRALNVPSDSSGGAPNSPKSGAQAQTGSEPK